MNFAVPANYRIKLKEIEKKVPRPCKGVEKTVEHESDVYTNYNWYFWYSHQRINKGTGGLGNRTSGDHQNYCIIEIGQNTEKSPGDLGRFVVSQTTIKDHQLTLMGKTL